MTKLRTRAKGLVYTAFLAIVVFSLSFMLTALGGRTWVADAAAADVVIGFEGSGVLANGKTKAQTDAAFTKKFKDVNAKIEELNTAGTSLTTAFNDCLIPVFSKENNGILTTGANRRSGYKSDWEGLFVADLKNINNGYSGWGDAGVGCIVYDAVKDTAYIVAGRFAAYHYNNQKTGSPIGDAFKVDSTTYQNFTGGYLKTTSALASDNNSGVTRVMKKNFVNTGTAETPDWKEVDCKTVKSGNATGLVGAVRDNGTLAGQANTISTLFQNAYNDLLTTDNFYMGSPHSAVVSGQNNFASSTFSQLFWNGDSAFIDWGDGRANWSWLVLNHTTMQVFPIINELSYAFESSGLNTTVRNKLRAQLPTGKPFEFDGNRYQNFSSGYVKITGTTPSSSDLSTRITFVDNMNITGGGVEISVDPSTWVGVLGATVISAMPEGVTQAELSKMFEDKFAEYAPNYNSIIPMGYVAKNGSIISQTYTTKEKAGSPSVEVTIIYNPDLKAVHFLNAATLATYKNYSALGHPNTDLMIVAQGGTGSGTAPMIKVQGFKYGYIKIISTIQYDDETFETYYEDKGFATVGASFDSTFNYFATINYVDAANTGKLSTATTGDSRAPSFAYNGTAANGSTTVNLEVPQGADLTKAFKDAYSYYWNLGFSVGEPDTQGVVWWLTGQSGIVKQGFKGGNGTGNLWGDNAMLVYDCNNKIVRLVTDNIASQYGNLGASGNGWPVSEMMFNPKTNTVIQNFNVIDPVTYAIIGTDEIRGRRVHFVANLTTGQVAKNEGAWYDFSENNPDAKDFVEYLTQYSSNTVVKEAFDGTTEYAAGATATFDFNDYLDNSQRWDITWDTDVAKGTLSSSGVWTYTPADNKIHSVELSVNFYTAFEKLNFTVTLNFGSKAALQTKYDAVLEMAQGNYTDSTWTAFTTARTAAKTALDKADATQTEVDAALTALNAAQTALVEKGSKTALQTKYDAVKDLLESAYTPASWTAFNTAKTAAKTVIDNANALQADIDAALAALTSAHTALVARADKSALQTKYDAVKDLEKGNYTDETWTAFTTAKTAANTVIGNANATQTEVDSALAALNAAHTALAEKAADNTTTGCGSNASGAAALPLIMLFAIALFLKRRFAKA